MPLALAAIGLTAAGTTLNVLGNKESQSAMNATRAAEVAQQKAIQQRSNQIFNEALPQSSESSAASDLNSGANARFNSFNNLQTATTPIASALPATGTATATSKAAARANTASTTFNNLYAKAQGKEGSYGDLANKWAINNADTAQKLGVQNNFSQGDARLLPLEMEVASHKGDKLSGWGTIASSLGMLAGLAGVTGAFGTAVNSAGVPLANVSNAAAEAQGLGAAGTTGSRLLSLPANLGSELPAVNDSVWSNIYNV